MSEAHDPLGVIPMLSDKFAFVRIEFCFTAAIADQNRVVVLYLARERFDQQLQVSRSKGAVWQKATNFIAANRVTLLQKDKG